jgi:hypothetical protein
VHLLAGDPGDTSSAYRLNVGTSTSGGVPVFRGKASDASPWLENTVTVAVTGGVLYVTNIAGATNNKIDAIDVTYLAPSGLKPVPAAGPVGSTIVLGGANLVGTSSVQFNGLEAKFNVVSATQIKAVVPAGAITGPISVRTRGGTTSSSDFVVGPRITGLAPAAGAPGDSVTIAGVNFAAATAVKFNGLTASFTVDSATQITATVPAGATTGPITVTTVAGTATSMSFVVAPRVSGFGPTGGPPGMITYLTGVNFVGVTSVQFNGLAAAFAVLSPTRIKTVVPAGALTGPITVTNAGGSASGPVDFKVAPRLTGFGPGVGAPGDSVTISGVNFTGVTSVKFAGMAASFTVDSATQITAIVPVNALSGAITVTTSAGTAISTAFVVAPRITSFTPTSGKAGTAVTINGANFGDTTSVSFNGVAAVFKLLSSSQIRAVVPTSAGTGPITVQTSAGTATSATNFTRT